MGKICRYGIFVFLLTFLSLPLSGSVWAGELQIGQPSPRAMQTVFSGLELMHFTISWTGGVKIGNLFLSLRQNGHEEYEIYARVTDYGLFKFFYPVDDTFVTMVAGADKLPYRYDVVQKEGRGTVTRRFSQYDQEKLLVTYRKNDNQELQVDISEPVHNEFSSFYITRSMVLEPGNSFMVPTFADKKVNEVKVEVKGREDLDSPFGRVRTLIVAPIMKFKGLYDKAGDTVIWMTDDQCRVPIKIQSKILIGSLTADLESYANAACDMY